ncbi:MAG: VWA domain-containing protein [Planctomycetes bacterium]|nr:VWA domain-containing protein [Planctomycetota bacterium]
MTGLISKKTTVIVILSVFICGGWAQAQINPRILSSNVIMPQSRELSYSPTTHLGPIQITQVIAKVDILDQVATTTLEFHLSNPTRTRQEAEIIMPVPEKAVVRSFSFEGPAKEPTARILSEEEARRIYQQLVSKIKDPALLEFIGYNLIRSSVFPVEPGGTQKIRLTYEHILEKDGNRIDYILPRSEMLDYRVPWKISCKIRSAKPLSTVYSPSHNLIKNPITSNEMLVDISEDASNTPGAFRLSYLLASDGVSASMLCYPDLKVGGGYFLLLAGLPAQATTTAATAIKREVTIVLDRSGSMSGEKIEQVRESALQIIAGLKTGEMFNIIIYNNVVEMFSPQPVVKNRDNERAARKYLQGVTATGGTNIHDALTEALRQKPSGENLPIVLFLTDGLPTVGNTSEIAIRQVAMKANPYERRIFTLGVGVDVNVPLLEKIAEETRAKATIVLPSEDVEVKVGKVFNSLAGPVLANPEIAVSSTRGGPAPGRIRDLIPARLPDMFEGDQLVLLGQYIGDEPVTFNLSGNYLGRERAFAFNFDFDNATTRNSFVPRLWANSKIAELIDAIRQLGADNAVAASDPRIKELVDDIIRLSTEFGILTEYTAFLAEEGSDLSNLPAMQEIAISNISNRAMKTRIGMGAANQSVNFARQKSARLNIANEFYDMEMRRVSISNVQQVNDRAFYQRGNRWVDSQLVEKEKEVKPDRIIQFGSDEFIDLAFRLARENRQGSIAFKGEILIKIDGKSVLIKK